MAGDDPCLFGPDEDPQSATSFEETATSLEDAVMRRVEHIRRE